MNLALRERVSPISLNGRNDRNCAYEFDGVRPIAVAGGTRAHAAIQRNLAISIGGRLINKPCQFFGSDLKTLTSEDHSRYPDGIVTCSGGEKTSTSVSDPTVIFEILNPSTASYDRIVKAPEYMAMPSVRQYIMLEQDRVGALVLTRLDGAWKPEFLKADSTLAMPEIGVELPLAELYRGISFSLEETTEQSE